MGKRGKTERRRGREEEEGERREGRKRRRRGRGRRGRGRRRRKRRRRSGRRRGGGRERERRRGSRINLAAGWPSSATSWPKSHRSSQRPEAAVGNFFLFFFDGW